MRADPTMTVLADRITYAALVSNLVNANERLLMHRAIGVDFQQDYDDMQAALTALTQWRGQ